MGEYTHIGNCRAWFCLAALAGLAQSACLTRDVPVDRYADPSSYGSLEPSGSDAAMGADAAAGFDAAWPNELDGGLDGGDSPDAMVPPPNPDCDFSGHWIVVERMVSTGLGIQQATQWQVYYDVEQRGDALRVRKGLACANVSKREGPLGVDVDTRSSWQATQDKNDLSGVTGAVRADANGCELQWGRSYRVVGATTPFYADPATPLPELDEPATADSPGWEDWDDDGMPGISVQISGALSGTRNTASRLWTSYSGRVAKNASSFRIAMDWNQANTVLGVSSDVLKAAGTKDGDTSLHFAFFERLPEDLASGSDDEICANVRERAPELKADGT